MTWSCSTDRDKERILHPVIGSVCVPGCWRNNERGQCPTPLLLRERTRSLPFASVRVEMALENRNVFNVACGSGDLSFLKQLQKVTVHFDYEKLVFLEQQRGKKEKNENEYAFSVNEEPCLLFGCLLIGCLVGWLVWFWRQAKLKAI